MKTKLLIILLILVLLFSFSACTKKDSKTTSDQKINEEYLTSDYAEQLTKDKAKIHTGIILSVVDDTLTFEETKTYNKEKLKLNNKTYILYQSAQVPDGEIILSKELSGKLIENSADVYDFYVLDDVVKLIIPHKEKK